MSTPTIDYAQLAAQSGAIASIPAPAQTKTPQAPTATGGGIDYNALAVQSGAINHFEGSGQTTKSPEQEASDTRQMLVSGLTGMPTPNMTAQDRQSFEAGKAAGAISVPIVAGATAAATALPEVGPSFVEKAKAVAEWAKANPIKSVVIAKIADDLGIHPFDMLHSVVKYGKNLFGSEDE